LFYPAKPEPALRRKLKLGDGPVLGFLGGLRPWHGVEVLPKLLARLTRRHSGAQLVITGDGPLRCELDREFKRRRLSQRVVFTGALSHENVPEVIRQFDVALAPYPQHDHDFYFSPLKLFEYLACGVPVVAAGLGQISEIVAHGRTGWLYPAGNLSALVAGCDKLLGDDALRASIGRASAELVLRKYTWDHNAEFVIRLARKFGVSIRK